MLIDKYDPLQGRMLSLIGLDGRVVGDVPPPALSPDELRRIYGLMVRTRLADQKTALDLAAEIQDLARAARARTLDLADLKGGTFSITNVGLLGGDAATPIINYPEVAILGTMRIAERVRAVDGRIAVRTTLPLCLSFDHRVIDGAEAARFMNDLKSILQDESKLAAAVRAAA